MVDTSLIFAYFGLLEQVYGLQYHYPTGCSFYPNHPDKWIQKELISKDKFRIQYHCHWYKFLVSLIQRINISKEPIVVGQERMDSNEIDEMTFQV